VRVFSYRGISVNRWKFRGYLKFPQKVFIVILQVEHIINELSMLDALNMIEGYLNLLIERVDLIEKERFVSYFSIFDLSKIASRLFKLVGKISP
jgi:hypothetical protein